MQTAVMVLYCRYSISQHDAMILNSFLCKGYIPNRNYRPKMLESFRKQYYTLHYTIHHEIVLRRYNASVKFEMFPIGNFIFSFEIFYS